MGLLVQAISQTGINPQRGLENGTMSFLKGQNIVKFFSAGQDVAFQI